MVSVTANHQFGPGSSPAVGKTFFHIQIEKSVNSVIEFDIYFYGRYFHRVQRWRPRVVQPTEGETQSYLQFFGGVFRQSSGTPSAKYVHPGARWQFNRLFLIFEIFFKNYSFRWGYFQTRRWRVRIPFRLDIAR